MKIKCVVAPLWDANPFSEDEKEQLRSDEQYNEYCTFYHKLLPNVEGLCWADGLDDSLTYVFSRDTICRGEYRVSVFDDRGAIRHTARKTIAELFRDENFPCDGRTLRLVAA